MSAIRIGVIIPCLDEEATLALTAEAVGGELHELIENKLISPESFVCFVDDGSRDRTWEKIQECLARGTLYRGIKLSRNVGHQRALLAGLMSMRDEAEALISMDADLQDPASVIPTLVNAYRDGHEIVYGVRESGPAEAGLRAGAERAVYRFARRLGVELVENHADCRLLGARALDALSHFDEANLFLRGIIPLLGYPSTKVYYRRTARISGRTKYPGRKLAAFAAEGVLASSGRPLAFVACIGFLACLGAFLAAAGTGYAAIFGGGAPGWAPVAIGLFFLGGVQLLAIGLVGRYLAKLYEEVKRRPRYFIEKRL